MIGNTDTTTMNVHVAFDCGPKYRLKHSMLSCRYLMLEGTVEAAG